MRSMLSLFVVLLAGGSLLWWGTDGLQAFTAEGARRLAVLEQPQAIPETTLQDQDGRELSFRDYKDKLLLMTFIYTRCGDACPALELSFQQVYEGLPRDRLGTDVAMLTVSFDPENDSVRALHQYATYFDADGTNWRMVRVPDPVELERLLDRLGVVVIPDGNGGFEHNTAIYLVDRQGKVARIFDFDDPGEVLQSVEKERMP